MSDKNNSIHTNDDRNSVVNGSEYLFEVVKAVETGFEMRKARMLESYSLNGLSTEL